MKMSSGETMCVAWCLRSCVVGTVKQGSMDMMKSDEICVVGIVEQESMESDEGGWIVDTAEEEGRATFASAVLMQLVFLYRTLHSYGHSCTWYSIWLKSDRSAPMFFAVATLPQIAWCSRICRISKPSSFRAWIAVFRRQCAVYFVFYSYTRFVYFSSNKKQFKLIHIACIDFVESPILKIA